MSEPRGRPSLEDVLDAYLAQARGPNSDDLAEWQRRFPEYAQALAEFAVSWSLNRWLPAAPEAGAVDEATLARRGLERVARLLEHAPRVGPRAPLRGLLAEARALGFSHQQLARETGLGVAVCRKLDQRLIRFSSIPARALEVLATALQRDTEAIAAYLRQPPVLAAEARYRARRAPELGAQEDFFAAVRADPTLAPEQRRAWLALEPRGR